MSRQRPRPSSALQLLSSLALATAVLMLSAAAVLAITGALDARLEARSAPPRAVDDVEGVLQAGPSIASLPAPTPEPSFPPPARVAAAAATASFVVVVPGLATGLPDPVPPPVPAAFLALETDLAALAATFPGPGELAIAVTDLQSGHTIAVDGDRFNLAGCIPNLFVILESLRMVQAGELPLDAVDPWIYSTTWSSNAASARVLYSIVGGGDTLEGVRRVRALIDGLGLGAGIRLDHPPAFPGLTLGLDPNNWVTALDVNQALVLLYTGAILDPAGTAHALDAFATVKPGLNYLTAAGVPADVVVSHKNGFLPTATGYVDNDAGLVRFRRNGREYAYAVTFLSQNVPYKYAELTVAQAMMARIWTYFDAAYPPLT